MIPLSHVPTDPLHSWYIRVSNAATAVPDATASVPGMPGTPPGQASRGVLVLVLSPRAPAPCPACAQHVELVAVGWALYVPAAPPGPMWRPRHAPPPGDDQLVELRRTFTEVVQAVGIAAPDLRLQVDTAAARCLVHAASDELYLRTLRHWEPALLPALGGSAGVVDAIPELIVLHTIPELRTWIRDAQSALPPATQVHLAIVPGGQRPPATSTAPATAPGSGGRIALDHLRGYAPAWTERPIHTGGSAVRDATAKLLVAALTLGDREAIDRCLSRDVPLGMPPQSWLLWQTTLLDALDLDGVDAGSVDIRLVGSAAKILPRSARAMTLRTYLDAALYDGLMTAQAHGDAVLHLAALPGHTAPGLPFDAKHRLRLGERSDYDLEFSSTAMVQRALTFWRRHAYDAPPITPDAVNHGYLRKDLVAAAFPALRAWSQQWTRRLGRTVSYAVFLSSGPEDTSHRLGHRGLSVHHRPSDWLIHLAPSRQSPAGHTTTRPDPTAS